MSAHAFAILCVAGFLVPVPILAWLDRPRRARPPRQGGGAGRTPADDRGR